MQAWTPCLTARSMPELSHTNHPLRTLLAHLLLAYPGPLNPPFAVGFWWRTFVTFAILPALFFPLPGDPCSIGVCLECQLYIGALDCPERRSCFHVQNLVHGFVLALLWPCALSTFTHCSGCQSPRIVLVRLLCVLRWLRLLIWWRSHPFPNGSKERRSRACSNHAPRRNSTNCRSFNLLRQSLLITAWLQPGGPGVWGPTPALLSLGVGPCEHRCSAPKRATRSAWSA